ncbi:MAG: hypothetical protein ACYDAK_02950 [Candidatus Limnocylindrales bacterium]
MAPRFDHRKLTSAQQEQRIRAAAAKAAMSRDGLSLRRAAGKHHLTGRTILRWFPGSIVRDSRGYFVARPDDEVFPMLVTTTRGVRELEVRGSVDRQAIGAHADAMRRLLDPDIGDPRPLLAMRGTVVAGHELETDPDVIEELTLAGELDFLSIYLSEPSEDA